MAEEKLKPPPPPPPPPLPPAGIFSPLRSLLKSSKSEPNKCNAAKPIVKKDDPAYTKAVEEMMERIKRGTLSLRSTQGKRRPSLPSMSGEGDKDDENTHSAVKVTSIIIYYAHSI